MEPMWMRLLNPALLLRNIMTPGPADQVESRGVLHRDASPAGGSSERADVLVYETEPLAEPVEVTGRVRGRRCGSRRARSTPTSPRS